MTGSRRTPRLVRVRNVTKGTLVAERCRVASSMVDRTVGLLATAEVAPGEGLWIDRSPSIHMFFMRYAIDAVFVDAQHRVTRVVPELKPWRVVAWARGARDCLELRAGAASATATTVGDELVLEPLEADTGPGVAKLG